MFNVHPFSSLSHKHQLFQKRPSTGMYSSDNLMIALLKDLKYYIDETMHKKNIAKERNDIVMPSNDLFLFYTV